MSRTAFRETCGIYAPKAAWARSSTCREYALSVKQDAIALALAGGEDYELLFTVPARHRASFQRISARRRCQVTRVGRMTAAKEGLQMTLSDGGRRPLPISSYEHFRRSP